MQKKQTRTAHVATEQVAAFAVNVTRYLEADGTPVVALSPKACEPDHLLALYRSMLLARRFDAKAVALQRTGKLGTYAASLGQEAVAAGVAHAMTADDVMLPTYRESAAQLARGVTMVEILRYWGGDERGSDYAACRQDFPPCVPVASQLPHAAGAAFALKRRGSGGAVVCFVGDGGTSKGDFYEAINLAGVWQLPMVVVINNNQWAISVSRARQTAAQTLAQKGIAAGIACQQVDGNDVIAVHEVVHAALRSARNNNQPALIEALTYRRCDHTTADDASRYRPQAEIAEAERKDPLLRLEGYMRAREIFDDTARTALHGECDAAIDAAVAEYLATPPRAAASIFDHLYAELPPALAAQRDIVRAREAGDG